MSRRWKKLADSCVMTSEIVAVIRTFKCWTSRHEEDEEPAARVEEDLRGMPPRREGTPQVQPVLLNTLQSGSSDVCDLSTIAAAGSPASSAALTRQPARPSPVEQGELVSVNAPVMPLVPD